MVDIHCHLLPLVDDGPSSVEQTLELARQTVAEGIRHVIATPHLLHPRFKSVGMNVTLLVAELNVLLKQRDIPLTVYPGHEVHLHEDLLLELERGAAQTLAHSRYLLLHVPDEIPSYATNVILSLVQEGYRPVLTRPEKHPVLRDTPDLLTEWIVAGAVSQVSCASIAGRDGKDVQRFAFTLLRNGLAQLIGSDAHHATDRPVLWRTCEKELTHQLDAETVSALYHNTEAVLADRALLTKPPRRIQKNWKGHWV